MGYGFSINRLEGSSVLDSSKVRLCRPFSVLRYCIFPISDFVLVQKLLHLAPLLILHFIHKSSRRLTMTNESALSKLFSEESTRCDTRVESHTKGILRDQV